MAGSPTSSAGRGGLGWWGGWAGPTCGRFGSKPSPTSSPPPPTPDFPPARYDGNLTRVIGVVAAIGCSFLYVVAQIYGVGLITSRMTGVAFEIGVFLGLGGILVCSFLGGMRAVTWTQVAQYVVLLVAFIVPVTWLSIRQHASP